MRTRIRIHVFLAAFGALAFLPAHPLYADTFKINWGSINVWPNGVGGGSLFALREFVLASSAMDLSEGLFCYTCSLAFRCFDAAPNDC